MEEELEDELKLVKEEEKQEEVVEECCHCFVLQRNSTGCLTCLPRGGSRRLLCFSMYPEALRERTESPYLLCQRRLQYPNLQMPR
jgi:hypothetical protein